MFRVVVVLSSLSLACHTTPTDDPDAAVPTDARRDCTSHADCDDERFCNGFERCELDADGSGRCEPGIPPCGPGNICDDVRDRCELCTTDADGDGYVAAACGGDDCDDNDASINPGATEVCDADHVDEDCDPTTLGGRDVDEDGWVDAACCNAQFGVLRCGGDCDDTAANVNPMAPEVCDEVDNDCDGRIDEGVAYTLWPDADRDSFGDADGAPFQSCQFVPGHALIGGDCDDAVASVNPGVHDVCNGVDDDCDGRVDEGAEDFCRAALGVAEAACVRLGGEDAPRCVVTRCETNRIDCNHDPSDGCEADFCGQLAHCGECGGYGTRCSFGFCSSGRCAPSPASFNVASGTIRRDRDGAPIAGARVSRLRECGGPTIATSDASGVYELEWSFDPPGVRFLTEAEGYVSQVDNRDAENAIRLIETSELEAQLAMSPLPVDRRLGIVVVDVWAAGTDLAEPISGTFRAPAIPSSPRYDVALPDGRVRQIFTNVRPGTARVRVYGAGDSTITVSCGDTPAGPRTAPTFHDVVVVAGPIVHLRFGWCEAAGVGG